jgi:hypothetical protein
MAEKQNGSRRPIADISDFAQHTCVSAHPCKLAFIALVALSLNACSPPKQEEADTATVEPQRNQVGFFERPVTLAAVRASGEAIPALVLLETDAWAAVMGSDSPRFALYNDGTAIWRRGDGFRTKRLNGSEMAQLYADLNLDYLGPLHGYYDAAPMTDQPEATILDYRRDKATIVSVYGSLSSPEVRRKTPKAIVGVYDKLLSFDQPGADWLPDKVEVMVWPYEHAPEASIVWPKDLPDLTDASTVQRGDSFSIYVPSSKLRHIRDFLAHRKEKGAIEIGGKKWAAAIRFPFPAERLWMAPNVEAEGSGS